MARSHPYNLAEVEVLLTRGAKQVRERGEARRLEQRRHADPMPERRLNTGEQTGSEQGVTTQLEEIGRRVDRLDPQDFAPDLCEADLEIIQRLPPSAFGLFIGTWQGQHLAVDLAVRQQWDGVKNYDVPW